MVMFTSAARAPAGDGEVDEAGRGTDLLAGGDADAVGVVHACRRDRLEPHRTVGGASGAAFGVIGAEAAAHLHVVQDHLAGGVEAERHVGDALGVGGERGGVVDRAGGGEVPDVAGAAVGEQVAAVVLGRPQAVGHERAGGDVLAVAAAVERDRVGAGRCRRRGPRTAPCRPAGSRPHGSASRSWRRSGRGRPPRTCPGRRR